jgi:hypothetical protein
LTENEPHREEEPPTEDGLLAAARALDGELKRTTRFRLIGGRCFDRASIDSPALERLAAALGSVGARFTGDYSLKEIPKTRLRLGEVDGGRALVLVVSPPAGRDPYAELTTWFDDGTALTTNGRAGEIPERPLGLPLTVRPDLDPVGLLELHRQLVAEREAEGRRVEVLRGLSGPFSAVARYLDALGF